MHNAHSYTPPHTHTHTYTFIHTLTHSYTRPTHSYTHLHFYKYTYTLIHTPGRPRQPRVVTQGRQLFRSSALVIVLIHTTVYANIESVCQLHCVPAGSSSVAPHSLLYSFTRLCTRKVYSVYVRCIVHQELHEKHLVYIYVCVCVCVRVYVSTTLCGFALCMQVCCITPKKAAFP